MTGLQCISPLHYINIRGVRANETSWPILTPVKRPKAGLVYLKDLLEKIVENANDEYNVTTTAC
jgi:Mg2+/Co2+ transporter CorC